jgi:tetratricopeptide (TPR) repeat protein
MRTRIVPAAAVLACLLLGAGMWAEPALSQQASQQKSSTSDKELCALMIRKGKESFGRNRYAEAKEFFRRAVSADPGSKEAWSNYDLAVLYSVAEQYKDHGGVAASTAPAATSAEGAPASPSSGSPAVSSPSDARKPAPQASVPEGTEPEKSEHIPVVVPKFRIENDEGC